MCEKIVRAILVLVLAFVLAAAGCIYAKDAQLQASSENVYEDAPAVETPTREVVEVVIDLNDEQPDAGTEEPPADEGAENTGTGAAEG